MCMLHFQFFVLFLSISPVQLEPPLTCCIILSVRSGVRGQGSDGGVSLLYAGQIEKPQLVSGSVSSAGSGIPLIFFLSSCLFLLNRIDLEIKAGLSVGHGDPRTPGAPVNPRPLS